MCMVQYSINVPPHVCSWVEVLETIKTETKQSHNVYIIIVPHSDAYLTSLYSQTLNLSYMLEAQHLHCYTEGRLLQLHLAKVTFQGTICER